MERFREHAVSALNHVWLFHELRERNAEILRTQQQLIIQEKMSSLGTLTAGIAHELRNPLNFVNNFAIIANELSEELKRGVDERKAMLGNECMTFFEEIIRELMVNSELIRHHGDRASRIVSSMMTVLRGGDGSWQDTDINDLVTRFFDLTLQQKMTDVEISVQRSLDPVTGTVKVNMRNLSRVLINLFNNAVEAVQERQNHAADDWQPALSLITTGDAEHISVVIKDNGPGIPASIHDRILNPFFTTKTRPDHHLGLGLGICYDIVVREHHGALDIDSQEGMGTTVTLTLPRKVECRSETMQEACS